MITILNIIGTYLLIGVTLTTVLLLIINRIGYLEGYIAGYSAGYNGEKEPEQYKPEPIAMTEKVKQYVISVVAWPYVSAFYATVIWVEIKEIIRMYKEKEGTP